MCGTLTQAIVAIPIIETLVSTYHTGTLGPTPYALNPLGTLQVLSTLWERLTANSLGATALF